MDFSWVNIIDKREWEAECLKWHGRILDGKYKHYCPEWDFLPVDDTLDEFKCCLCFGQTQKKPTEGF